MSDARMNIDEFASAEGISTLSAMNALRADSKLPRHERRYPFITALPPTEHSSKWTYIIPRAQYEQWKAGNAMQAIDIDALAEALAEKMMARFALAFNLR